MERLHGEATRAPAETFLPHPRLSSSSYAAGLALSPTVPVGHLKDLAFDHIIDAILDADPKAVQTHQENRRQKKK